MHVYIQSIPRVTQALCAPSPSLFYRVRQTLLNAGSASGLETNVLSKKPIISGQLYGIILHTIHCMYVLCTSHRTESPTKQVPTTEGL